MNIKQTLETLKAAGFEIETFPRPWRRYEAKRKDSDGNGVRVWLFFGERSKGGRQLLSANSAAIPLMRGGRQLVKADTTAFPLFGEGALLNGAKKRDFEAGREVSRILQCEATAIGCTMARFSNGKLIKK